MHLKREDNQQKLASYKTALKSLIPWIKNIIIKLTQSMYIAYVILYCLYYAYVYYA
jgi:hypothetical protein